MDFVGEVRVLSDAVHKTCDCEVRGLSDAVHRTCDCEVRWLYDIMGVKYYVSFNTL